MPGSKRPRSTLHRGSVLVLVMGVVITCTVGVLTRRVVNDNERKLLVQESSISASAFVAFGQQMQASLDAAATVAVVTGGDPAAFARVSAAPANGYFTSFLLMHSAGATLSPLVTVRPPTVPIDPASTIGANLARTTPGPMDVVGIVGSGAGRNLVLVDRPVADPAYLVYAEVPIGPPAPAPSPAGSPESSKLDYAIYLDASEHTDSIVLTNTARSPLGSRHRAALVLDLGSYNDPTAVLGTRPGAVHLKPGQFLMVAEPRGSLVGRLTANLALLLVVGGLLGSLVAAFVVDLVLRQRDRALALVRDLETNNAALDQALGDQARSERERNHLESQLRQAQRLEAVGQLAGGIAHDFNNLLAVILNYGAFAVDALDDHPARRDVEEIVDAARRAANLTRQLLVFSRRDIVHPEALDLNAVVSGTQRLLDPTLGEDIDLTTSLADRLPPIEADIGELEQVLLNLAVNARDAMPDGGRLSIETSVVEIDGPGGTQGLAPGTYVRLSVADTGTGIPDSVLPRIFEPFFTTKAQGEGTGMGLATVYGTVTRWGGHISVTSSPGEGSMFTILFPAAASDETGAGRSGHGGSARRANGVGQLVLVVEDEEPVRRAARRVLERAGYQVLEAGSGPEALEAFEYTPLDLLLTDVVMPGGMSGKNLAEQFRVRQPQLPVLFMSGYNADLVTSKGSLDAGVVLLEKPFTAEDLLTMVRTVLDHSPTAAPT